MLKSNLFWLFLVYLSFGLLTLDAKQVAANSSTNFNLVITGGSGSPVVPPTQGGSVPVFMLPTTRVSFSGQTTSGATVVIMQNGQRVTSTIADKDGKFNAELKNVPTGLNTYSLTSTDAAGNISQPSLFTLRVVERTNTQLSGLSLAPTIEPRIENKEVVLRGYTVPNSLIYGYIEGVQGAKEGRSDERGRFELRISLNNLKQGQYGLFVKVPAGEDSERIYVTKNADSTVTFISKIPKIYTDLNKDGRIDLVDFSILAFWYLKPNPPEGAEVVIDGVVDLRDFSVLAYYWTD